MNKIRVNANTVTPPNIKVTVSCSYFDFIFLSPAK